MKPNKWEKKKVHVLVSAKNQWQAYVGSLYRIHKIHSGIGNANKCLTVFVSNLISFVFCVPYAYDYKMLSLQNWLSTIEILILDF